MSAALKNANAAAAVSYDRKRAVLEFHDPKDAHEAGLKFIGTYLGFRLADGRPDPKTGEVRQYKRLFFQRRDPVTLALLGLAAINSDKGLVSGLDNAMVLPGDTVEIEWLRKDAIGNEGRSVNVYDIYTVSSPTMPKHTERLLDVAGAGEVAT